MPSFRRLVTSVRYFFTLRDVEQKLKTFAKHSVASIKQLDPAKQYLTNLRPLLAATTKFCDQQLLRLFAYHKGEEIKEQLDEVRSFADSITRVLDDDTSAQSYEKVYVAKTCLIRSIVEAYAQVLARGDVRDMTATLKGMTAYFRRQDNSVNALVDVYKEEDLQCQIEKLHRWVDEYLGDGDENKLVQKLATHKIAHMHPCSHMTDPFYFDVLHLFKTGSSTSGMVSPQFERDLRDFCERESQHMMSTERTPIMNVLQVINFDYDIQAKAPAKASNFDPHYRIWDKDNIRVLIEYLLVSSWNGVVPPHVRSMTNSEKFCEREDILIM